MNIKKSTITILNLFLFYTLMTSFLLKESTIRCKYFLNCIPVKESKLRKTSKIVYIKEIFNILLLYKYITITLLRISNVISWDIISEKRKKERIKKGTCNLYFLII